MNAQRSYGQFCPVAMASEILCTRWTVILLRELIAGSTRFNDLRRGIPRMSPALLSLRLKELEEAGVVARLPLASEPGVFEYVLTDAGRELGPIIDGFGRWGQRWVSSELSLEKLDAQLLMWDMRRGLIVDPLPERRCVIQFRYAEQPPSCRCFWLVVEPGNAVQLCSIDPGFDVDLYVATDLRTATAIWMGHERVRDAIETRRMLLTGDPALAGKIEQWLGLSPFARVEKPAVQLAVSGQPPQRTGPIHQEIMT